MSNLDRFGAAVADIRAAFNSPDGWAGDLGRFAQITDEAA
jgi:hypothetical protein